MARTSSGALMGAIVAVGLSMTIGCETMELGVPGGGTPAPAVTPAGTGSATPTSGPRAAAGTSGDSLQACLARIPQDATASQRMLAEGTCRRDEEVRQPIMRVPGTK